MFAIKKGEKENISQMKTIYDLHALNSGLENKNFELTTLTDALREELKVLNKDENQILSDLREKETIIKDLQTQKNVLL